MQSHTFRSFAVVPAAGRSTRMGAPKLLLPWGTGRVIEAQLAAWRASDVTTVVVVVHPLDSELAAICRQAGAEVVIPAVAPPTMKSSVLAALEYLTQRYQPLDEEVWLLAPADMPLLRSTLINQLLGAYDPARPRILVPECQGQRGHPVLFPWQLVAEVRRLSADEGLNALSRRHGAQTLPVADPAALQDIDTPEEYERLAAAASGVVAGNATEAAGGA